MKTVKAKMAPASEVCAWELLVDSVSWFYTLASIENALWDTAERSIEGSVRVPSWRYLQELFRWKTQV